MKKYENKFPELKEINPKFLLEIEKWLIENQWIDPIEQAQVSLKPTKVKVV